MKRLFVIPLVGVMLTALAMPVLAEGRDTLLKTATPSQSIAVQGIYEKEEGSISETVYSVDIEWGSMEFVYSDSNVPKWDPRTHRETLEASSGWKARTGTSSTGLVANAIRLTNHSNIDVSVLLKFQPETFFSIDYHGEGEFSEDKVSLLTAEGTDFNYAPTKTITFMPKGKFSRNETELRTLCNISISLE